MFVLKKYKPETIDLIENTLQISLDRAVEKEVSTYLVAQYYADKHNEYIQ